MTPHTVHGVTSPPTGDTRSDPASANFSDDDILQSDADRGLPLPYARSPDARLAHVQATAFTLRLQSPWSLSSADFGFVHQSKSMVHQ